MNDDKIKVLVVDDSAFMRLVINDILHTDKNIKVRWVFILWFLFNTAIGLYLIYEMILESKFNEVILGPIVFITVLYILIRRYPKFKKNAKEELLKTFKGNIRN